jgi:hypothetical protein
LRITEDLSAPIEDVSSMEPGGSPNFKAYNEQRRFNNGGQPQQHQQNYAQTIQPAPEVNAVPMLSDSLEESSGTHATQSVFAPGGIGVTGAGLF